MFGGVGAAHGRCLSEAISFSRELRSDHLCNEAMLVAQELHHFEGRRDCVGYGRLSGVPPLAIQHESTEGADEQSFNEARRDILRHCLSLSLRIVSNDCLKFKRMFETSASPEDGDCMTFSGCAFFATLSASGRLAQPAFFSRAGPAAGDGCSDRPIARLSGKSLNMRKSRTRAKRQLKTSEFSAEFC
jgi:hypothetical protein